MGGIFLEAVVRADASTNIGTGHIMRCLAFSDRLKNNGYNVTFICRELPGNLCNFIENKGFRVCRLPYRDGSVEKNSYDCWLGERNEIDAEQTIEVIKKMKKTVNWLIVDHYALDHKWENLMRSWANRIMVIDDLANRVHDCEILLDQNYLLDVTTRYHKLVSNECIKFLGPQYALLRSEFLEIHNILRNRSGIIERILVFFGGSDLTNETGKVLEAIKRLNLDDVAFDVIIGELNPNKELIREISSNIKNINLLTNVQNMAEIMNQADIAIGAGGITTWERCSLGLPAITMILAENQRSSTEALESIGGTWNLGYCNNVLVSDIVDLVKELVNNPAEVKKVGETARGIMGRENIVGLSEVLNSLKVV